MALALATLQAPSQLAEAQNVVEKPVVFVRHPTTGKLSRSDPNRELTQVAEGTLDTKFVGLAVDSLNDGRIFWSDGSRIQRADADGTGAEDVVPQLVMHVIGGVNFGDAAEDLEAIVIKGVTCTSTHWWSAKLIGCATTVTTINDATLATSDVKVTARGGGTSTLSTVSQQHADARQSQGYTAPLVASVTAVVRSSSPSELAYAADATAPRLYWSDHSTGLVLSTDDSGFSARCHATGVFEAHGLAAGTVDGAKLLYYTNSDAGTVVRVDVDATTVVDYFDTQSLSGADIARVVAHTVGGDVLLSGLDRPRGIALDATSGYIYVTENSGRIYRARADGRNMEPNPLRPARYATLLLSRGSSARLDGIAVTQGTDGSFPKSIYWTETNTNGVWRASIYGSAPTRVAGDQNDMVWPRAIALLHEAGNNYAPDQHLFWTQYIGRVHRSAGDGLSRAAVVDTVSVSSGYTLLEQELKLNQPAQPHFFNVDD